jgi:hypothetical protein
VNKNQVWQVINHFASLSIVYSYHEYRLTKADYTIKSFCGSDEIESHNSINLRTVLSTFPSYLRYSDLYWPIKKSGIHGTHSLFCKSWWILPLVLKKRETSPTKRDQPRYMNHVHIIDSISNLLYECCAYHSFNLVHVADLIFVIFQND